MEETQQPTQPNPNPEPTKPTQPQPSGNPEPKNPEIPDYPRPDRQEDHQPK